MAIGRSSKWVDRFGEVLDHGRALAREQGAQFYMVYLPSKRRYANSIGRLFQDIMRERILTLVQDKLRIPVVDLVPVFDVAENPSELFLDHYTAIGNRLVANTILRQLKKSNLH